MLKNKQLRQFHQITNLQQNQKKKENKRHDKRILC